MHDRERTFCFDPVLDTALPYRLLTAANDVWLLQRRVEEWDSLVHGKQRNIECATDEQSGVVPRVVAVSV